MQRDSSTSIEQVIGWLLGEITDNMRAISFFWGDTVVIRYYLRGNRTKLDSDAISCIEAEAAADLEPDVEVESCVFENFDSPLALEDSEKFKYVFVRRNDDV